MHLWPCFKSEALRISTSCAFRVSMQHNAKQTSGETISSLRYVIPMLGGAVIAALTIVAAASQQPPPSGRAIFLANCATCHGEDGRGMRTPAEVGFELTFPDFTDCSFATREADADWSSTIHR